jgi:hypothetical protein
VLASLEAEPIVSTQIRLGDEGEAAGSRGGVEVV